MGRSRKCNWKRKLKKAEKKNKPATISGFDYYKLNLDLNAERNKKWWDEMYRQYKELGSNIIFTKSRRGGYNSGIIMEMAIEFAKRSGYELIHVKPNDFKERLKGAPFDLYDGVDPELMSRIEPERLREYWRQVMPEKSDNSVTPILFGTSLPDTGKGFFDMYNESDKK